MIPERLVLCGLLLATTGCCALVLDDSGACQPVVFIPFTDQRAVAATAAAAAASDNSTITTYHGDWPTAEGLARSGLSLVAVAEMARQHFVSCVKVTLSYGFGRLSTLYTMFIEM